MQPNISLANYNRALQFAIKYHDDQRRKNKEGLLYLTHLVGVANLLVEAECEECVVIAGLLHDVIEDTQTTEELVKAEFGDHIAYLVKQVTNIESDSKLEIKKAQVEKSAKFSYGASLVKLADKIDNLRDLNVSPPLSWSPEYVEGYFIWCYAVCKNLFGLNRYLDNKALEIFKSRGITELTDEQFNEKLEKYYASL